MSDRELMLELLKSVQKDVHDFKNDMKDFNHEMKSFVIKLHEISNEVQENKCQRLRCFPLCEKEFVTVEGFNERVRKAHEANMTAKIDFFNKLITALKGVAWILPTVVLVLYFVLYGR